MKSSTYESIGQFRIPGRTGASGVKLVKVRLMRGRNESTRAVSMANIVTVLLLTAQIRNRKKHLINTWDWQTLDSFSIPSGQRK